MRSIVAIMLGLALGWLIGPPAGEAFMDRVITRGAMTDGWQVRTDIGRYDGKWLLRSIVARVGLGALVPEEALYYRISTDATGRPLNTSPVNSFSEDPPRFWTLTFSADQLPPADAFWSLSPYEVPSLTLVENWLGRYQIGDRTPGLMCNADGDLQIVLTWNVEHDAPANYLPLPNGEFDLALRLYEPRLAEASRWSPPEIVPHRVDDLVDFTTPCSEAWATLEAEAQSK